MPIEYAHGSHSTYFSNLQFFARRVRQRLVVMLEYGGPLRDSLRLDSSYDTRCFYISPTPLRGVVGIGKSRSYRGE